MKPRAVVAEERENGVLLLRHPDRPLPALRSVIEYLRRWAREAPNTIMLTEPARTGGIREISYSEMLRLSTRVAQGLLNAGLSPGDRIMILSAASIDHAILQLAALTVGMVVAPISPNYSLHANGYQRLQHVAKILSPRLIYAEDPARFAEALAALSIDAGRVLGSERSMGGPTIRDLAGTEPGDDVEAKYQAIRPETPAKILFTSGSTGLPKGVINTHGMLAASQVMLDAIEDSAGERPERPVVASWLPWHHTMAGNATFMRNLRQGGTFHIDDGNPTPQGFQRTLATLARAEPTVYSDVPIGFSMLADAMSADANLRDRFFKRLESLTYAGASLPDPVWRKLQMHSIDTTGYKTPVICGLGATETSPALLVLSWTIDGSGYIGLPLPGCELKLLPLGDGRYELRARGPNITPGYFEAPEATAAAFDEDGFYKLGDAVRFANPQDKADGLCFAGRLAEEFKLQTGTWVSAGQVRTSLLDEVPLLQEVAVTGLDRAELGIIAWLHVHRAAALENGSTHLRQLNRSKRVQAALVHAIQAYNETHPASSMRIARIMLMDEPPSAESGEVTDKGSLSQRVYLDSHPDAVDQLYSSPLQGADIQLQVWGNR